MARYISNCLCKQCTKEALMTKELKELRETIVNLEGIIAEYRKVSNFAEVEPKCIDSN